ncbi:MAG TPA: hypothetical protein VER11_08070 [Polyangiaceae bacterium]|nr:hypothetical protein [Polyangiaceae bacterium]
MAPGKSVSHELDRAIEQASASAIQLSAIGVQIRAVLVEERHSSRLSAQVLAAHAGRAALALTRLASCVGQIDLLAKLEAQ